MKRFVYLTLIIALVLAGCNPFAPQAQPTEKVVSPPPTETANPPAAPTPTIEPSATPTATQTLTPTVVSTEAATQEFILANYEKLALDYDPSRWVSEKGMGQGMLIHLSIPNCEITDQGPTEPPRELKATEVGKLRFSSAEFSSTDGSLRLIWYLLQGGIDDPYLKQGTIPILVVQAPKQEDEACMQAAEEVLKTLHPVKP